MRNNSKTDQEGRVLVLAPSPESKGGISSVIGVYRDYGLFSEGDVNLIHTQVDGNWLRKAHVALRALGQVAIQLVTRRAGCVHAHVATGVSFWRKSVFMALAAATGRPFIFHLHAGGFAEFYEKSLGRFGRWMARWLFRKAARVVVLSPEWSRWLQGIEPASRVTVIPNPVLAETVGENRAAQSAVLFLGRLGPKKGTVDLILAFRTVVRSFPEAILYLAGDGDAEGARAQAAALGIERNVRIVGWVRGERKNELMSQASIFVLPSYFEGLPMSVLEAMAWGIPIVTTRVGGIPFAVTDEVEGLLIQPGDTEALARALVRLLGDPELRSAMGRAGRARARGQFSAQAILPQVRHLYADVSLPLGRYAPAHIAPARSREGASSKPDIEDQAMTNRDANRVEVLGCHVDNLTMSESLEKIEAMIRSRRPHQHVVVNADKIVKAHADPRIREIVNSCDMINADGMPVIWAARVLGRPLKERVTGIDLFECLVAHAQTKGWRVYFLGARQPVLEAVVGKFQAKFPRLKVAGFRNGYWNASEETSVIEEITRARADILFVAISSPKKEEFLNRYQQTMRVPFAMGVGGSFDVVAGLTKRAPRWMQDCGLEWFFRFLQEPRRMFHRYFVEDMSFFRLLAIAWWTERMQGVRRSRG